MAHSSYGQFCPVAMAAEILCTRWTVIVLRELIAGSTRFNDLRRGVPRMSPALLSQRLKQLEQASVISRSKVRGEPSVYEYQLTRSGRDLQPFTELGRMDEFHGGTFLGGRGAWVLANLSKGRRKIN